MIHLDANYLIRGNQTGTPEDAELKRWLESGEMLATSSIAWMEFVSGPVSTAAVESIRHALGDRIVAFTEAEAELAALLYNSTGRRRSMRYDCMIAAAAISAGAELATANQVDFSQFVPHGLKLGSRN
ncbi:MAG TPA: PIN domain-containing protein [Opitutaceae bacterium]|nr:PIN domain-containing protein [Opitutaceae bacterium]